MKWILMAVVGLPVLVGVAFFVLGRQSANASAPGMVDGHLAPCPSSPNCVSSEANTPDEKKVAALPVDAWDALPGVIAKMGGAVTNQDASYLAAEFTSSTFRFVDDVEFRRTEEVVHLRSASRVGYSDRGVNKARAALIQQRVGSSSTLSE